MNGRWTTTSIPDCADKTILITGANSGLGYASTVALAARGAHVIMACRNPKRAAAAVARARSEAKSDKIEAMSLDLGDLSSVSGFAEEFRSRFSELDVLMNNAGVMATPRGRTRDGFETQIGINHLGHFALTASLFDLVEAASGRVVNVSSIAARSGVIQLDDLMSEQGYSPFGAYAQSKLANLVFTFELGRRIEGAGSSVSSIAAHPGGSNTNLGMSVALPERVKKLAMPLTRPFFMDADRGALSQIFAAVSRDARAGAYYGPDGVQEIWGYPAPASVPRQARDSVVQRRLWELSEKLTGVEFAL